MCEVDRWDVNVFKPGDYALESLLTVAAKVDFAVLIASPDDIVVSRGGESASVRDNVLLEFGLFAGVLGRQRTYLLATGDSSLKLPTDILGLTRLPYRKRTDGDPRAALNEAVVEIEQQVRGLGRLPRRTASDGVGASNQAALDRELELLCANARAQGWTVKANTVTTLRLRTPRGRIHTLSKGKPEATRADLRRFAAELRAAGLRVNTSIRRPAEESPL